MQVSQLVAILVLLYIPLAIAFELSNRVRFTAFVRFPMAIYYIARKAHSYPILTISAITVGVLAGVFHQFEPNEIVLVTLFYATVLFLGNIFQRDRPFPIRTSDKTVYDREYANSELGDFEFENDLASEPYVGFEYTFQIANIGDKDLLAPILEYRPYAPDFQPIDDWKPVPDTSLQTVAISTKDEPQSFSITGMPVTEPNSPDFYLVVRVRPRRGNRVLCHQWVEAIGVDD